MAVQFGQSVALNSGVGGLTAAASSKLKEALERLEEIGLWDVASEVPRESPELAPIDAMAANWPEISNPRVLGGRLPFRFWQCEALIGEAIDHLNHCVSERQQYDDLRARVAGLWLEIQAFLLDDNVTEEERQSPQRQRQRDILQTSIDRIKHHIDETGKAVKDLKDHLFTGGGPWDVPLQADIQADIARVSSWSPYWNQHQPGEAGGYTQIDANDNPVHATTHGALHDWIYHRTLKVQTLEFERAKFARERDFKMLEEDDSSSKRELAILEREQAILDAAIGFEDQRIEARRMAAYLQIVAMTEPGGPHNYLEQMRPVRLRFLSHMADAVARLLRAAEGMQTIYGFPLALPDAKAAEANGYSYLDVLIAWVQQAASFLTRFGKRDQVTDIVVSVRRTLGTKWDDVLDDTDPRYKFRLELPVTMFDGMYYPRFRGVVLFAVVKEGSTLRGTFAAQLFPPRYGLARYFSGGDLYLEMQSYQEDGIVIPANPVTPWSPAGGGVRALRGEQAEPIDQTKAPPARSGRVGQRESLAGYDIVGTVTLANLSPIGKHATADNRQWVIEIDKLSSQGESFKDLVEDLDFELHVAYQESLL